MDHSSLPLTTLACLSLGVLSSTATAQATATEIQKLAPNAVVGMAAMGRSIALEGNRAIVTADNLNSMGSAFVYSKVGALWVETQQLTPNDLILGDLFGFDVSMTGDYAACGAPSPNPFLGGVGAVYVYHHDGVQWVETQKIQPPDGGEQNGFGDVVMVSGDWLFVGRTGISLQATYAGAVYVYQRTGTSYTFQQKLVGSSTVGSDRFGTAIACDGLTLAISAIEDDDQGSDSGSVFTFRHNGLAWVEQSQLIGSGVTTNDWFGWSVDVDGDVLAAGAINHDAAAGNAGSVHVFRWNGVAWIEEQKLQPAKLGFEHRLGWSLALEGDRLVAGAAGFGVNGFGDGALYHLHYDGSRWVDVHQWLASDYGSQGFLAPNLGLSVAMDGTTVIGGAPWADTPQGTNVGAAYVFERTDLGLDAVPDSVPTGGTLQLETWGGLAGAPMGLLLANVGGPPLNIVLGFDVFDASGTTTFSLPLSPSVSGLSATFLTGGFWQSGVIALSNTAVVTFQ